jgi:hypothetical protein
LVGKQAAEQNHSHYSAKEILSTGFSLLFANRMADGMPILCKAGVLLALHVRLCFCAFACHVYVLEQVETRTTSDMLGRVGWLWHNKI